jgi:uncharacterized integral membrane protein
MSVVQPARNPAPTSPVPQGSQAPSAGAAQQGINGPEVGPAPLKPIKEPRSTHASRAWNGVVPAVVLLAFILVFVFQNLHKARVSFLTVSGSLPLAVALLGAAAFGGLFVLALGSARIMQLRKVIRRNGRANDHAAVHRRDASNGKR